MNNPRRILQTLDHHLTAPAEITLFGRAALALGYPASPPAFATTGEGCFGWIEVRDEGSRLVVNYAGRNHHDEVKVKHSFAVKA